MSLWENDKVQFARLLCEIIATQDNLDLQALCESMDLPLKRVQELFERAHSVFEEEKQKQC